MMRCVYTTQKHKKLKTWMDGFAEMKGKRLHLYDSDMVEIHNSIVSALNNEMEIFKYLVYIESFENLEENGEREHQEHITRTREILEENPGSMGDPRSSQPGGRTREEIINLFEE
ncbi:hypothetical protein [Encephalitozoon cuniculi GB-M1]|uniref:5'-3' DNA helicase ZGRF1-like N-terminal domain-containing protein n=2 Tax=Encephalitozoon cuniculi TaxID=6035 RepID=Q8STV3_ENCCU|nr:uncharacterized protein ECU09_0510 [Encephalitozoon cuniculi GB-M1]AGE96248.1 hypothetical protein ECU09_0510 [Encephalitozoon cuniculi]KMV65531.1 hypothetical protein M970_090530 [Encephalitozoon cuniculi EcunIII-L]UYI26732.1 hypothetical protein J0A71_03g05690 [Encephalitozoon cuniculi]CAD27023.1 hypothetical protein [Encephalitozoon cuniculi GB-M1]